MKKLIAFSYLILVTSLSVVLANPLPLLIVNPWMNFSILGNAVDVAAITAFADEHKRDIINTLINDMDIAKDITVIPNVKNKVQLTKLTVADGARPYSSTHEPKSGALVFSDRELSTSIGKRDLLIDHRDFKAKHLAWRTRPGNNANKDFNDMEFAPFTWMKISEGVKRELNDQVSYLGFDRTTGVTAWAAAGPYAVGNRVTFTPAGGVLEWFECVTITLAGESPTTHPAKWLNVTARAIVPGLKVYVDAAIAGGFTVSTTGAITDGATARAAFKKMYRDFTAAYKNQMVIIHASYTDCEFLLDGMETVTQYTTPDVANAVKMGLIPIFGTNNRAFAKPATWLGTSRRLIAEPMEMNQGGYGLNLVMGTDLLSDVTDINVIEDVHTLKAGLVFDLGFQIQDLAALRLGNQA